MTKARLYSKLIWLGVVILFFSNPANAVYELQHFCPLDVCLGNGQVTFALKLSQDKLRVQYTGIDIIDTGINYTISQRKNLALNVTPGKNISFTMSGVLPNVQSKMDVEVVPCFTFFILDDKNNRSGQEASTCGSLPINITVYAKADLLCTKSSECQFDSKCMQNTCVPVKCGECQYIESHGCKDFECCSSAACPAGQQCQKNICIDVVCMPDERIIDHKCEPLKCDANEKAVDGRCEKLNCTVDEKIVEHECIPLGCRDDEIVVQRTCKKFECTSNRVPFNHTCIDLVCGFFQRPIESECKFNLRLLVRILLSIGIMVAVGGWLYRKYKEQHPV